MAALTVTLPFFLVTAGIASAQTPPKPEATPPKPEATPPKPEATPPKPEATPPKPDDGAAKPDATPPKPEDGAAKPDGQTTPEDTKLSDAEPTAEDLERAKEAFIEGNQFFQAEDYDVAVEKFKLAYRLSKNPLLLYNIGFTHDKRKDRDLALFYYDKFIKDAGEKAQMYDEVKTRIEAIKKAKEADAFFDSGSMGKVEDGEKPRITEFMHKVVEEVPPGYPLDITAFVPEASGWQVTLFYRAAGEERFDSTLMRERYNELVGRIPESKTRGKTLQYYIEVRDKQGAIIARSGRSASPNLVFVEADAKPRYYPDVESEGLNEKADAAPDRAGGNGGSGATEPGQNMNLGFMDMPRSRFEIVKWSTTGAAAALLIGGVAFNLRAGVYTKSIEDEVERSTITDTCPSGPCRSFSLFQKELQRKGKQFETMSYWTTGLGVATAGVAGYLWYKQLTQKPGESDATAVTVVPVLGDGFVGTSALLSF